MKWFDGPVGAAVLDSKKRKCVFVVYIRGDNELTVEMDKIWDNVETSTELDKSGYVALRLQLDSDAYKQFSQIYPVVCVPSTYFIGDNGVPLEITAGSITQEEFVGKIQNALRLHKENTARSEIASTSTDPLPSTSQDAAVSTSQLPTNTASYESQSQPTNSESSTDDSSAAAANEGAASVSLEDKVERARKMVAEKQEEKTEQDKKETIRREMERRKHGQESTTTIKRREVDHAKQLALEIAKERADDKAARQRVREQISIDRSDRAAKYQREKEERAETKRVLVEERESWQRATEEETIRIRSTIAKIQFRMSDGSFVTNQFPATVTLREARDFIAESTGRSIGSFVMSTMYPRILYTEEHMMSTLSELNLTPSAVIILLPNSSRSNAGVVQQSGSSSGLMGLMMTIIAPLIALWTYFTNFISGGGGPPSTSNRGRDPTSRPSSSSSGSQRRPPSQSEASGVSHGQSGNIRRFRNPSDFGEDDTNTWNGNSTQQM